VVGGLSHPAIVGIRVVYRFTEEVVIYLRGRNEITAAGERAVLYGAGGRCQLFLKERSFSNSSSFDGRAIAGLIDDEPSLQGKWVYGYQVLGGRKDLPSLITRHRITRIIITAALTPESRLAIQDLSLRQGLQLSEWCFENRMLIAPASHPSPVLGASGIPAPEPSVRQDSANPEHLLPRASAAHGTTT
jgi:FlaA1/EpsC-like NDP-sugar epimerase